MYSAEHGTVVVHERVPDASAIEPPGPGCAVTCAISAVCRLVRANLSRSTSPWMPLIRPVQEYCQNVHPCPCQSLAGIDFGSGVRGHANHSGKP